MGASDGPGDVAQRGKALRSQHVAVIGDEDRVGCVIPVPHEARAGLDYYFANRIDLTPLHLFREAPDGFDNLR